MTAKQLVQERLPSWSEEQAQRALQAAEAEEESEPKIESLGREGGNGDGDDAQPGGEARIHALQEVFETFASMDFLPREDAWH